MSTIFESVSKAAKRQRDPYLRITNIHNEVTEFQLVEGESIFAGAGSSCRIKLLGDKVAQFHCMFVLNDGQLSVHDCNTGGITNVNGQPLHGETNLEQGDEVTIGDNFVVAVLQSDLPCEAAEPVDQTEKDHDESTSSETALIVIPDLDVANPKVADTEFANLDFADREFADLDSPVELLTIDDSDTDDYFSTPAPDNNKYEYDSAACEELELLRSEVELLQSELAEKDAQLFEIESGSAVEVPDSGTTDESEVVRLVNRLEDLLAELQISDERISVLNDLLRASDEANQAEQEERSQIENWLSEIESRVSQRESDMEAEVRRLEQQCDVVQQQRSKAEAQVKKLMSAESQPADPSSTNNGQIFRLQEQLAQQNRVAESINLENEELKKQLGEIQQANNAVDMRELEQKMAQVELETSRERAEVARQRAELELAREEFERTMQPRAETDNADSRIVAMRLHLREIHEEEKSLDVDRKQNSLSGRIAKLLGRV